MSDATAVLESFLSTIRSGPDNSLLARSALLQFEVEKQWIAFAVISMWCALLFRGGLLLHGLGIAVVTRKGCKASRLRMLWRSFVAWSPLFLIHTLLYERFLVWEISGPLWLIAPALALFVGGAVWAVIRPDRSLQDYLARTWLVPR